MQSDKIIRFQIAQTEWNNRKLKLWAKLDGTTRASLASSIVLMEIGANWPDIDKELNAIATHEGISREELETKWLCGDD